MLQDILKEFEEKFPWTSRYKILPPLFENGTMISPEMVHLGSDDLKAFITSVYERGYKQALEDVEIKKSKLQ